MNEKGWAAWRAAEERLAEGEEAAEAAAGLPERQAWILRATDALERNDLEELKALRGASRDQDLVSLAGLALTEPGEFNPTRFRAGLKRMGVSNNGLPTLDLLRYACVAHNGDKSTRHVGLADAAHDREVLDGALMVLSRKFKPYRIEDRLMEISPRMASFWAAGIARQLGHPNVREFIVRQMPDIDLLSEENWPDLDRDSMAPGERSQGASLEACLKDPLGQVWGQACQEEVEALAAKGVPEKRQAALGGLLDAIHVMVRSPSPLSALPATMAAMMLGDASPDIEQRHVLMAQVQLIDLRLRWASGDIPLEVLDAVWAGLGHLEPARRAHCAHVLLERGRHSALPRSVAAEVLALALQHATDWDDLILPWILRFGDCVDPRAFLNELRGVSICVRERAMGYLHAARGAVAHACRCATLLFREGEGGSATHMALIALEHGAEDSAKGRQERRQRLRAMTAMTGAALELGNEHSVNLAFKLLAEIGKAKPGAERDELTPVAQRYARRSLEQASPLSFKDITSRLGVSMALDGTEEARALFREYGRWLRRAELSQSLPSALDVCGFLCVDEQLVDTFMEGGGRAQVEATTDPRFGWLKSITAWLDRQATKLVGDRALAMVQAGSLDAASIANWYESVSELTDSASWEEVQELAFQGELGMFDGSMMEKFEEFLRDGGTL